MFATQDKFFRARTKQISILEAHSTVFETKSAESFHDEAQNHRPGRLSDAKDLSLYDVEAHLFQSDGKVSTYKSFRRRLATAKECMETFSRLKTSPTA